MSVLFKKWRTYENNGLEQYTKENCEKAQLIMEQLISLIIELGKDAKELDKVKKFEIAVKAYNKLNEETDYSLIETGEREELFELIASAAGIDSKKYGDGEGIACESGSY